MDKSRPLVLRRNSEGQLCLHDVETGMPLGAQTRVVIEQEPMEPTTVTVTFLAAHGEGAVRIEVNDG